MNKITVISLTLALLVHLSGCAHKSLTPNSEIKNNAALSTLDSSLDKARIKDLSMMQADTQRVPVVLIAGTGSSVKTVGTLTRYLQSQGRHVYPVTLVKRGFVKTDKSVTKISLFIDQVIKKTGATKVDVVGWSQGAHVARRYLQKKGVQKVNTLVMLGSPTYEWSWMSFMHKITLGTCIGLGNCVDQQDDSKLLHEMNDGDDMPQGVKVFNVWAEDDRIVTPSGEVSKLKDGNTGKQFSVQSVCEGRRVGHFGLVNDPVALRIVEEALQGRKAKKAEDCQ